MATQTRPEAKARSFGENIESDLASRFLRVVEVAAIASARTMGQGERKLSDQVATEAMRPHHGFHPDARNHRHRRGRARRSAHALHRRKSRRRISRRTRSARGRHRRRSARRHQSLRHRRARRDHRARRF